MPFLLSLSCLIPSGCKHRRFEGIFILFLHLQRFTRRSNPLHVRYVFSVAKIHVLLGVEPCAEYFLDIISTVYIHYTVTTFNNVRILSIVTCVGSSKTDTIQRRRINTEKRRRSCRCCLRDRIYSIPGSDSYFTL